MLQMGVGVQRTLRCGRERFPFAGRTAQRLARMSPRSTNRFNSREVARALKAARLAGERPERVEIDPATGPHHRDHRPARRAKRQRQFLGRAINAEDAKRPA